MRTVFGFLNVLITIAFLLSVLVQYNDPDGLVWIGLYGAAAAVCIAFSLNRMQNWQGYATGAVAIVWAAFLVPAFWGEVGLSDVFESFEMKSGPVESAREFGGLLIVALWMFTLVMVNRRPVRHSSTREA